MTIIEEVHEDGKHGHMLELQGVMHHVMLSGPLEDADNTEMLLSVMYSGGAATMSLEDLKAMHRFLGEYIESRPKPVESTCIPGRGGCYRSHHVWPCPQHKRPTGLKEDVDHRV